MVYQTVKQILAIYSWLVIGVLFFFLWRIASFYEHASGESVGHRVLLLPAVLIGAGAVLYLQVDADFVGLPTADLLLFAGGILLLIFGGRLQKLMTGE